MPTSLHRDLSELAERVTRLERRLARLRQRPKPKRPLLRRRPLP